MIVSVLTEEETAAYACMIVRKAAATVFRAFADPAVTTRFWYSKSSGPMVPGAELRWEWETYGASAPVRVLTVEEDRLIAFEWGNYAQPTTVTLTFSPLPGRPQDTFVEVRETGFHGQGAELVTWLNNTVGGFTTVLCAMKALLEHGIDTHAVADHHPA